MKALKQPCFLILAFLVAVELGKVVLFMSNGPGLLYADTQNYWELGGQVAQGDLLLCGSLQAVRPPLYPAFLGAFRAVLGEHALFAATLSQHLALVGISLVTAWICWRLTGSRGCALAALALSAVGTSKHCVAQAMWSDNLLCVTFVVFLLCFLAWFKRPSLLWAASIGAAIAACMLVKPVAQLLWVPTLFAMALRLWELGALKKLISQGTCLAACVVLLVAPWFARNWVCFGQPFLTKITGRALWVSCFTESPQKYLLCKELQFPDSARAASVLAAAEDGRVHCNWPVYRGLRRLGYSEIEADDLMTSVSLEAIRAQPVRFVTSRLGHYAVFWLSCGPPKCRLADQNVIEGAKGWPVSPLAIRITQYIHQRHWLLHLAAAMAVLASCTILVL